jgi:hypothetical protein
MSDGIGELRKEFDRLVNEASAFLKEVEPGRYVRLNEGSWYRLTSEEMSSANDIRYGIRCLLARLASPVQRSPLLDKRDFRTFVRLGRAMDAALHFRMYRRTGVSDPDDPPTASRVFNEVSEELAELLDLIPEEDSHAVEAETDQASTERRVSGPEGASNDSSPARAER